MIIINDSNDKRCIQRRNIAKSRHRSQIHEIIKLRQSEYYYNLDRTRTTVFVV